jgi:acyl-CoA synthetase (AMP-forming)/AMP-acid ligase II
VDSRGRDGSIQAMWATWILMGGAFWYHDSEARWLTFRLSLFHSYLYITGRSKEIINKGGEVISPFEVEEAIMVAAKDSVKVRGLSTATFLLNLLSNA